MNKPIHTILVASADLHLSKNLSFFLEDNGYKIVSAANGIEALYLAEKSKANVVILDADLPILSASDTAVLIRKIPQLQNAHVFFLHPKDYSFTLNGIVDEYVEKPANIKTFASKIKNIVKSLNVRTTSVPSLRIHVGDLIIDRDTYMVYHKGKELLLPRKEFELLYLLASRPEKVFTREEIFKNIWHKDITPVEGRTIDVHIRKLRSKISENLITTVKGIGYRMIK